MKKQYITPATDVEFMAATSIIAASDSISIGETGDFDVREFEIIDDEKLWGAE